MGCRAAVEEGGGCDVIQDATILGAILNFTKN